MVDLLAVGQHGLEIALRLDASAGRDTTLQGAGHQLLALLRALASGGLGRGNGLRAGQVRHLESGPLLVDTGNQPVCAASLRIARERVAASRCNATRDSEGSQKGKSDATGEA